MTDDETATAVHAEIEAMERALFDGLTIPEYKAREFARDLDRYPDVVAEARRAQWEQEYQDRLRSQRRREAWAVACRERIALERLFEAPAAE